MKEVRDVKVKCNLCGNILDLNSHDKRFGKCECGNSQVEVGIIFIKWNVPKELKGKWELYSEYSSSKYYYTDIPKLTNDELKMLNYIQNSKSLISKYTDNSNLYEIYASTKEVKFVKSLKYSSCILKFKGYNHTRIYLDVDFTKNYSEKLLTFYRLCRMADKNLLKLDDYIESIVKRNINIMPNNYEEEVTVIDFNICL